MMLFKVPKELAEQPMLACEKCGNPVPNDMLEEAHHGTLEPCPRCGGTMLVNNPCAALTYATQMEYDGVIGLMLTHPAFEYARMVPFIPEVDTTKKKKKSRNPINTLLDTIFGE